MTDTLLLYNMRTVGHFTVYSQVMAAWALSRGLRVVYCGLGAGASEFGRRFGQHPEVEIREVPPLMACAPSDPLAPGADEDIVQGCYAGAGALEQARIVRRLQEELAPRVTVLVNLDDFVYNLPLEDGLAGLFATPTYGVLTFSNRDHYCLSPDLYSWRVQGLLKRPGPFAGLLDLDEYHVARVDPGGRLLGFMPDIYREPDPVAGEQGAEPQCEGLRRFLEASEAPVLPILGKIDDRKNSLWILEAACATPALRVAVLGQRVALRRNAGAFDALLHQLDSQGRLYLDQGFVPQAALDMVLASPVVPCLPLPYLLHTGSSGLQLLAAAHGKPCLVPDYGLMASRAVDAGLGPVFAHGQCASFRRGLDRLLAPGAAQAYAPALARFMEFFTPEATYRALDHGFGLAFGPAPLPPWSEAPSLAGLPARAAQAAYSAGDPDTAVEELDAALRHDPEHHGLGFLKAMALSAAGRADEATAQMALLKERGQAQIDCAFHLARLERFLPVLLAALEQPAQAAERDAWLLRCLDAQLGLLLDHLQPAELQSSRDLVEPLRTLGDEAVRSKRLEMARKAYARAVECDPDRSDSRLNLSDVLRYLDRMVESLAMLDELAARSPEEPGLACKRGQVYAEQGRLEDAVAEFHRELARGPSTFADMAEGHLARVLKRLGDGAADS